MYGISTYIWLISMVNVGTVNIPYMNSMGMGYGGFVPPTLEGI